MWLATMLVAAAVVAAAPADTKPVAADPPAPVEASADPKPVASDPPAAGRIEWSGRGRVEYQVSHKLHEVHGVSDEATTRATTTGDVLEVVARARVDSFRSGNGNRDRHALEAIEAERFPVVEIRGTAKGLSLPLAAPEVRVTLSAKLDFHGVALAQEIPLVLKAAGRDKLEATFDFPVSLEAHRVERPSLFKVKVADSMRIRGTISLERVATAAPSASQIP